MSESPTLNGLAAAPGVAIGSALLYNPDADAGTAVPVGTAADEQQRLEVAIAATDGVIAGHETSLRDAGRDEDAEIFAAHRMMLDDPGLRERAAELIAQGQSAAAAFSQATEEQAVELEALDDEYLSARAVDVRDIAIQVRRALSGGRSLGELLTGPAIVVAHDLGPSDLMSVPRERLLGFALAAGGMTAHSSILARSLGIPAVVGLGQHLLKTVQGTETLALDGGAGKLLVNPPETELQRLRALADQQAAEREVMRAEIDQPSVTADGVAVILLANAANAADAAAAQEWGAAGIGLLRTELLFLDRADLPDEDEQLVLYQAVAAALPNQPITVRTLDVGGDKPMPALSLPREANPFLGWRGLRIGLDRPETLLPQLRALLRAGADADIRIMLPMVTSVDELRRARALLDQARRQLQAEGLPCAAQPQLGMMVEVPAAALNAVAFAQEADFFSIGTNDLTQYTLACDRGNEHVSDLYQPLDPAVLRLIAITCEAAHAHGRHVAICGDLGGNDRATALLIGLGVDELSCAAGQIPLVRRAIRATDTTAARELAAKALECATAHEVHALLGL